MSGAQMAVTDFLSQGGRFGWMVSWPQLSDGGGGVVPCLAAGVVEGWCSELKEDGGTGGDDFSNEESPFYSEA